jgi:diacylglycerol kinase (ATP)
MRTEDPLHGPEKPVVLLVANRRAGARSRQYLLDDLTLELEDRGFEVVSVRVLDEVAPLATQLHAAGRLRVVYAAGGDGTIAELANRLPPEIPLAIFPLGTENLLARLLGIRADPLQAADTVVAGHVIQWDVARANERIFLLMLGCGFDGHVVHDTASRRRGHIRRWHYAPPILRALLSYSFPTLRVSYLQSEPDSAGEPQWKTLEVAWAFCFNAPSYAGNLRMAPAADPRDGQLDLFTLRRGSIYHGLRYLWSVWTGRHLDDPDCGLFRTTRLRIESTEPVCYQLDGDPGGRLPVDVELLPGRLRLMIPERAATERPAPH